MPSLGFGATCDICVELYDRGRRAPCSIRCGHVYCSACLQQIIAAQRPRPRCAFCREPFGPKGVVKLHIDIDDVEPIPPLPPTPPAPVAPPLPVDIHPVTTPTSFLEEVERLERAFAQLGKPQTTSPVEFKRQLRNYITDLWSLLHFENDEPYLVRFCYSFEPIIILVQAVSSLSA
ncbi:hypothetical protein K435DRAFT_42079 [Dendrothele bispora CBS 962.96]|uniref:RING-type domain-containing protein n=1 Tax=Dendrothele bispora (strain CBS 962.96) TaxID=1314807 RepID=A0A4S8MT15_DENBC|nr:hypothetical protein K435DRAFT_42079 [Dendrothele bispora CBS 962.96]